MAGVDVLTGVAWEMVNGALAARAVAGHDAGALASGTAASGAVAAGAGAMIPAMGSERRWPGGTEAAAGEGLHLDAVTALEAFRSLELSPVELLSAVVARAEAVNGDRETGINAFTETLFEEALDQARAAADVYARCARSGGEPPALLGLPVATKEKHALAGRRTRSQGL